MEDTYKLKTQKLLRHFCKFDKMESPVGISKFKKQPQIYIIKPPMTRTLMTTVKAIYWRIVSSARLRKVSERK